MDVAMLLFSQSGSSALFRACARKSMRAWSFARVRLPPARSVNPSSASAQGSAGSSRPAHHACDGNRRKAPLPAVKEAGGLPFAGGVLVGMSHLSLSYAGCALQPAGVATLPAMRLHKSQHHLKPSIYPC